MGVSVKGHGSGPVKNDGRQFGGCGRITRGVFGDVVQQETWPNAKVSAGRRCEQ